MADRETRCAIYTRKSSEEGLDQAFNSLDAQREACEAYIASQKHQGWVPVSTRYDDGGVSGGTMERRGLSRLLRDIDAKRVDIVVVYKVDRLTRSLADFAKIVDTLDAAGASFVSVTQQFNTTTSMGRLTLNVLLSFAQFEREVTGERIRDKIAASKKKGMWMGGNPPLGYEVRDRHLVVIMTEAEIVKRIFRRYAVLGSVEATKAELDQTCVVSKRRVNRHGRTSGGQPIGRGALYAMLCNPLYIGRVAHKGETYQGQHRAIVEQALWDTVQETLARNRRDRTTGAKASEPSLLAGLIHDDADQPMTPTHASKKGKRYRYYVSRHLISSGSSMGMDTGRRLPAADIEAMVEGRIIELLEDEAGLSEALRNMDGIDRDEASITCNAIQLASGWSDLSPTDKRAIIRQLVDRVSVNRETVSIEIRPTSLVGLLNGQCDGVGQVKTGPKEQMITLSIPARLKRSGMEVKLIIDGAGGGSRREADPKLLRLVALAHRYRDLLLASNGRTMTELAAEAGVSSSYFTRVLKLSFLDPGITLSILRGRQPEYLNARRLASTTAIPRKWDDQNALLGLH
jgi:site-specific DNA recombinase